MKEKTSVERLRTLIVQLMRIIGFAMMSGYAVIGAFMSNIGQYPSTIVNMMMSVVIIVMLWLLVFVKDEW